MFPAPIASCARRITPSLLATLTLLLCAAGVSAQSVTFSGRHIQTGGQYQVAADFNGDGRTDLATGGLDVEILLGRGDATFRPSIKYPIGTSVTGITRGDFNNDARLDLVVTIAATREIGILLGRGDGTFQTPVRIPTQADGLPTSSVAADFNSDGKLDVMTSNPYFCTSFCTIYRSVTIFLGNGDGTFLSPQQLDVGTPPSMLRTGDFNRDGLTDVAAAAAFGKVLILLGRGDGTFRQMPDLLIIQNTDNTDLVVHDFNGDQIQDLVAAADAEHTLGVVLGNGDGTFRPPTLIYDNLKQRGAWLTMGDYNNDGRQDVGIGFSHCCIDLGSGTFGVMLSNGNGTFQTITRHIVPLNGRISLAALFPVTADFNGDGKPDVAAKFHNQMGGATTGTIILTNTTNVSPRSLALGTLSEEPASVVGGTITEVNIPLAAGAVAPRGNLAFSVSNNSPSVVLFPFDTVSPPFVMVQGMTNLRFKVETKQVSMTQTVTITVRNSNLGSRSVNLTVTPPTTPLALGTLEMRPGGVFAGDDASGVVTLETGHVAPIGGAVVTLAHDNPTLITSMPASVTIPAGQTTAGFPVQTWTTGTSQPVTFTANYGGVTRSASLNVTAPTQPVPISSVTLAPGTVTGGSGQSVRATVTLASNAPTEGALIMLTSSRPDVVTLPRSVRIFFSTQSSVSFDFVTNPVAAPTDVTINAHFGDSIQSAVLTVMPPPAGAALSSLTLNPASVAGGSTAQGTVTISAASSTPTSVSLASSSAPIVTVPSSVTIPAGQTSATFNVNTTSVSSSFNATITASVNGGSRTATLTVTPAADTVAVGRAEYESQNRLLRVEATSTRTNATLQVFVTSNGQLVGTLTNNGGGKYSGQLNWLVNPQNITVRSSFGGSATRAVALK